MSKQRYWEKAITALLEKRVISTKHQSLIDEIGEILAQPEQELLDIQEFKDKLFEHIKHGDEEHQRWLHDAINDFDFGTAPPKRKPLSDDWIKNNIHYIHQDVSFTELVRAVEKAHGIGVE